MKKTEKGISLILFAILLQLCSTGMELFTLGLGIAGLVMAFAG